MERMGTFAVVNRCEVYADFGKDGHHRFVSLNELGQRII